MVSLTRVTIMGNNNVEYMPGLYSVFPIVYISSDDYAENIGGEDGSNYFLLDNNGELYGQIKGFYSSNGQFKLYDIDSQINANDNLRNSLLNLNGLNVVKVGEFEIKKIVLWSNNNTKFSIHGLPILYNMYMIDAQTDNLQNKLNTLFYNNLLNN